MDRLPFVTISILIGCLLIGWSLTSEAILRDGYYVLRSEGNQVNDVIKGLNLWFGYVLGLNLYHKVSDIRHQPVRTSKP